jgi:putative flippase GtrA
MRGGLVGQIGRFGVVGMLGFGVDGGVLYALIQSGSGPYLARMVSFPLAVSVTWYLNQNWTFAVGNNGTSKGKQYAGYFAVQITGALTNYACYVAVLQFIEATALAVVLALAIGSVLGLIVNFLGARLLVFSAHAHMSDGDNDVR